MFELLKITSFLDKTKITYPFCSFVSTSVTSSDLELLSSSLSSSFKIKEKILLCNQHSSLVTALYKYINWVGNKATFEEKVFELKSLSILMASSMQITCSAEYPRNSANLRIRNPVEKHTRKFSYQSKSWQLTCSLKFEKWI